MDRGLLDGAEFNNPSSDRLLGFPDVSKTWMLRSYHQDCESFEIILNKSKHDSLPEEFQAILQYAAKAASSEGPLGNFTCSWWRRADAEHRLGMVQRIRDFATSFGSRTPASPWRWASTWVACQRASSASLSRTAWASETHCVTYCS